MPLGSLFNTLSGYFRHWHPGEADATHKALMDGKELQQLASHAQSLPDSLFMFDRQAAHPLIGEIPSFYRGQGFEFEENRSYQAGDEQRMINWRLYARTGDLYTKVFREERRSQVFLLMDRRAAMRFGTRRQLKVTLAARISACYLYQALHQALPVGGMLLNQTVEWFDPAIGEFASQHFLQAMNQSCPPLDFEQAQPNLEEALQLLFYRLPAGSFLLLVSDFLDLDPETAMPLLHQLASRHVLQAIQILDPVEHRLPISGNFLIEDSTSSTPLYMDAGDDLQSQQYAVAFAEEQAKLKDCFQSCGISFCVCSTDDDVTGCVKSTRVHASTC